MSVRSVSYFPFHVSEERFTSALDALTNYSAAAPRGVRRRCRRRVEETGAKVERTLEETSLLLQSLALG